MASSRCSFGFVHCLLHILLIQYAFPQENGSGDNDQDGLFLSSGQAAGDTCITGTNNECVLAATTGCNVPFANLRTKLIYVCTNGLVCFDTPYEDSNPPLNGEQRTSFNNKYCAALYHADINLSSGEICYKTYDLTAEGVSDTDADIIETKSLVNTFCGQTMTNMVLMFKATWLAAPRNGGQASETIDAQIIYATDGFQACAIYKYAQGRMNFASGSVFIGNIINGVAVGLPDQGNPSFYLQADTAVTTGSLQGVRGFNLTSTTEQVVDSECVCKLWNKAEKPNRQTYLDRLSNMVACPCNINQIRNSPDFTSVGTTNGVESFALVAAYEGSGKTCNFSGNSFLRSGNNVGSFQKINQNTNYAGYLSEDLYYRTQCCDSTVNLCDLFYEVRPKVKTCGSSQTSSNGGGSGDPHIVTLDGRQYTMNGNGEYIVMKSAENNLHVQARTEKAALSTNPDILTDATIIVALALQVTGAWVQVELLGDSDLQVFIGTNRLDGVGITLNYRENLYYNFKDLADITFNDGTHRIRFIGTGVIFFVTPLFGALEMSIQLDISYRNKLEGLLGNFNGDATDEFRKSDGTTLPDTASERQILTEFAQSWMTKTDAESIFKYQNELDHSSFYFPLFTPKFFDEFTSAEIAEAKQVACGEEGRSECIFDYLVTKNIQLAQETGVALEEAERLKEILENQIPSLSVTSGTTLVNDENYLYINLNENKVITLLGEDDGTWTVELFETTAQATLGTPNADGTFTLDITVLNTDPVSVSVVAKDNLGAVSPAVSIVIVVCNGCSSHGSCTNAPRQDITATGLFKLAACQCEPYWEGDDCELDVNGCEGIPCGFFRDCTDRNADAHKANPSLAGFTCGPCPTGYEEIDGACIDIDECTTGSPCPQNCQNTPGSYICQCDPTYRLDDDGITCNDINECDEGTDNCKQICVNIDGGFTCDCRPGFTFNAVTSECDQDALPPTGCDVLDCSNAAGCTLDDQNGATCFCNKGFELQPDNTCDNINECLTSTCSQTCQDTEGSFTCSCYLGFVLGADKTSCAPCTFPNYGEKCLDICVIGRGFDYCDPVRGPVCLTGWTGISCDVDIDECDDPNSCGDVDKICINTDGAFDCACRQGYKLDNGSCVDINECNDPVNPFLNTCEQICRNAPGSFSCSCDTGYRIDPNDDNKCVDIDECAEGISGCDQLCTNNGDIVGFTCNCKLGYELDKNDLRTCILKSDPCVDFPDNGCSQICGLVNDLPQCSCRTGFILSDDERTCVDVNECDPNLNLNLCSIPETCVNINGGYTCSCPAGFKLENDQKTCRQCDETRFGLDCANECACGAGSIRCDHVTGCVCMPGYTDDKCSNDRNECADFPCTRANEQCINFPGSFSCECESGYVRNGLDCEDINECSDVTIHGCSQNCTNTVGSFECVCNAGFLKVGELCNDLDECAGENDCSHACENTIGSYRCTCPTGFKLEQSTKKTCIPEEQCPDVNICEDNTACAVINGLETCTCLAGYQFVSGSDVRCEDILECSADPNPCSQVCNELSGGYECACSDAGFKLDADQTSCSPCIDNTYGVGCAEGCRCIAENTAICEPVEGNCTCKAGWTGKFCDTNINECLTPSDHQCPANSICTDNLGSFICQCTRGHIKTSDNLCQACAEGKFGDNCEEDCTCHPDNTQTCNNVDGSCACKAGWEGADCSINIDECQRNSSSCVGVPNSRCIDAQGSFNCECFVGFIKQLDGTCTVCEPGTYGVNCARVCPCAQSGTDFCDTVNGACTCKPGWESDDCSVNINECTRDFDCPEFSTCQDTPGSYVCNCNDGYNKTESGTCEDIDECTPNNNNGGCLQICDNLPGSFVCSCDIGYQGTGNDCSICVDSYGEQCANQCNCDPATSTDCNHVTGCVCRSGYTGVNCTDIDECTTILNVCQVNAFCTNTRGGHTCTCNPGFIEDQGNCIMCSGNTHGTNCSQNCNCVNSNTLNPQQSCDHVNGDCLCNPYWDGDRCENNIDECDRGTDNCTKPNEDCHDIDNGFNCSCRRGFVYDNDRNCIRDTRVVTRAPIGVGRVRISLIVTVGIILRDDIGVSLTYDIYVLEVQAQLVIWYRKRLPNIVFFIVVTDLQPGSLVISYDVDVPESAVPDVAAANLDLITNQEPLPVFNDNGNVTNMVVGNTAVPVSTAESDDLLCQLYVASINGCGTDSECVVQNNKPSCQEIEDDNFALIFGLAFGIPMFVLCVIAIVVIAVYIRQRGKKFRHIKRDEDDRSSSMFARQVPVRIVTSPPMGPMHGPPDLEPYEASEYSDYDLYPENDYRKREGQGSWNFLFGNLRSDDGYRIKRPTIDVPRGRYSNY